MLSWLTGSRLVDADEAEGNIDDTRIEPPDTPAPVFAVRAFKHAIFGTPQAPPTTVPSRLTKKRKENEGIKAIDINTEPAVADYEASRYSPNKGGILRTPGTMAGRRKEVTFGAQVQDNGGKKSTRSGLPSNYPGRFPSPWTPKTITGGENEKSKSKFKEAVCEAEPTGTTPRAITRAKDDADLTMDVMEPRSESGRYWKGQYMSYSTKSEEETRKLIIKQRLARDYARKKDDEATELRRQLQCQSKANKTRQRELEAQIKDLRENLRLQLSENAKSSLEIALLRKRLDDSEQTKSATEKQVGQTSRLAPPLEPSDLLWTEAVPSLDQEDDQRTKNYLHAAVAQSRGEQARFQRQRHEHLATRKVGSIARQDSGTGSDDPSKPEKDNLEIERNPTPTPRRQVSSKRSPLADRSPNVASSPGLPSFFSPTEFEKTMASIRRKMPENEPVRRLRHHREAMADAAAALSGRPVDAFDDMAPMDALSLQAEQPITPHGDAGIDKITKETSTAMQISRGHKRSEATSAVASRKTGLDEDRDRSAKERVAARKQRREERRSRVR